MLIEKFATHLFFDIKITAHQGFELKKTVLICQTRAWKIIFLSWIKTVS